MNPQTIALRDGDAVRRATFAVVNHSETRELAALPGAFLSESELVQFRGLRFPLKQQSFLLGRLAAKRALGALLLETDLRRIDIHTGVFGQPLVRHPRAAGAEVTVSHSHGLAVALAYPGEVPIGVDLETVSALAAGTMLGELHMSDAETAWLAAGTTDQAAACGVLWTAREALGKSMKIGLNCPLGMLALGQIDAVGTQAWTGQYLNFPQSRCLLQMIDGRALSIALPRTVEVDGWPKL